jgi:hypothetical protein
MPVYRINEFIRLVSNDVDDAYLSHQTVKVSCGAEVKAKLVVPAASVSKTLSVCRPPAEDNNHAIRTVHTRWHLVDIPNTPVIANADIDTTLEHMNRTYAQACIRFVKDSQDQVSPVTNCLQLMGSTSQQTTIAITVNTSVISNVSIPAGLNSRQVADAMAAAINAQLGPATAEGLWESPKWAAAIVVVDKGRNTQLAVDPPGWVSDVRVTIPQPIYNPISVNDFARQTLAANYGDRDLATLDCFVVNDYQHRGQAFNVAFDIKDGVASDISNTILMFLPAADGAADYPFCAAHEAGHCVFDDNQHWTSLMEGDTSEFDAIGASKRISDELSVRSRTANPQTKLLRQN